MSHSLAPLPGHSLVKSAETVYPEHDKIRVKRDTIAHVFNTPLLKLLAEAGDIHRRHYPIGQVQVCTLLSVKTGGCPENCSYCPQSAHYSTSVSPEKMLDYETVLERAKEARDRGSTRFCMGAAWKKVRLNKDFSKILEMVEGVSSLGLEVCCTLGMVDKGQAQSLKAAGLHAYNHNLDTGPEHYPSVVSTRSYKERLDTLNHVRDAGITVCCGGIIGMGETADDRIDLVYILANLTVPPESVPINALVPVEGTPLEKQARVSIWDMVRMIATVRICIPTAMVRLSAGRDRMSYEDQTLCFLAGANSIFSGEKLLTTGNHPPEEDEKLFSLLGLEAMSPHEGTLSKGTPTKDATS